MKLISIFGQGIQSVSPFITSQRRVNVFYDVRAPDNDKSPFVLCSTPGLTTKIVLPTSPIRGMWQNGDYAYVVAGDALYLVTPTGGFAFLGTFGQESATTPVSMATGETQLVIVDGQDGFVVNIASLNALINSQDLILLEQLSFMFSVASAV